MEELTKRWAERLLNLEEPTAGESADIKAFIREKGPMADQLAERWPLEADEVAFESAQHVGGPGAPSGR